MDSDRGLVMPVGCPPRGASDERTMEADGRSSTVRNHGKEQ